MLVNGETEAILCPGGKEKMVDSTNLDQFISLVLDARFGECIP